MFGALIIKATYGLDSEDLNSKYVRVMQQGAAANNEFLSNATVFEYFPSWARAPLWLPGTGVVRRLAQARATNIAIREVIWADAMLAAVSIECDVVHLI